MWGICLDSIALEDGLFQAVVQYKIDNSKALFKRWQQSG